jgi:hypothetical protein
MQANVIINESARRLTIFYLRILNTIAKNNNFFAMFFWGGGDVIERFCNKIYKIKKKLQKLF